VGLIRCADVNKTYFHKISVTSQSHI